MFYARILTTMYWWKAFEHGIAAADVGVGAAVVDDEGNDYEDDNYETDVYDDTDDSNEQKGDDEDDDDNDHVLSSTFCPPHFVLHVCLRYKSCLLFPWEPLWLLYGRKWLNGRNHWLLPTKPI